MIRVIIVEDDPMVAQLNAACLRAIEGFEVAGVFSNGLEALEFLKENPVELAIVDVYMPVCGGVELLRRMRGAWIQTSVILVTAATEMQVVVDAMELGIGNSHIAAVPEGRTALGRQFTAPDLQHPVMPEGIAQIKEGIRHRHPVALLQGALAIGGAFKPAMGHIRVRHAVQRPLFIHHCIFNPFSHGYLLWAGIFCVYYTPQGEKCKLFFCWVLERVEKFRIFC